MARDVVHHLDGFEARAFGVAQDPLARPEVGFGPLRRVAVDDDHGRLGFQVLLHVAQPRHRLAEVVKRVDDHHQVEIAAWETRIVGVALDGVDVGQSVASRARGQSL